MSRKIGQALAESNRPSGLDAGLALKAQAEERSQLARWNNAAAHALLMPDCCAAR
jgi:hypothetical protein